MLSSLHPLAACKVWSFIFLRRLLTMIIKIRVWHVDRQQNDDKTMADHTLIIKNWSANVGRLVLIDKFSRMSACTLRRLTGWLYYGLLDHSCHGQRPALDCDHQNLTNKPLPSKFADQILMVRIWWSNFDGKNLMIKCWWSIFDCHKQIENMEVGHPRKQHSRNSVAERLQRRRGIAKTA